MSDLDEYIRAKLTEALEARYAANTCSTCGLLRVIPVGDDFMCPWCGDTQPLR